MYHHTIRPYPGMRLSFCAVRPWLHASVSSPALVPRLSRPVSASLSWYVIGLIPRPTPEELVYSLPVRCQIQRLCLVGCVVDYVDEEPEYYPDATAALQVFTSLLRAFEIMHGRISPAIRCRNVASILTGTGC